MTQNSFRSDKSFCALLAQRQGRQAETVIDLCGEALDVKPARILSSFCQRIRRIALLPQISQQFEIMKANREKAVDVDIASAQELDAGQQKMLADALSEKLERKVNMQVSLDKSLLGGAVIRAGDTVIDGSIRGRLTKLAESFNS